MELHTGTSGFSYKEWRGVFYPEDLPASEMLAYYAERFSVVEINNTFYRMPSESTLRKWGEAVPEGFTFALKAPQEISHRKRLKEIEQPVTRFFGAADALGSHLGPILVQLPPYLKKDLERLEGFLALTPSDVRLAFEFRNASWFDEEVFGVLRDHGAALCITHGEGKEVPVVATAGWGYLRLRQVEYGDSEIRRWVETVGALPWSDVYVFFKHEATGTGPGLALQFEEIFRQRQIA
jgi:uncharacterized protein YecE (DUF72 family)